jgi:hypothetical protein
MDLTKRQNEVYQYILLTHNIKNRMPTIKEIVIDCNIGRGFAQRVISHLLDAKLLKSVIVGIPYKVVDRFKSDV